MFLGYRLSYRQECRTEPRSMGASRSAKRQAPDVPGEKGTRLTRWTQRLTELPGDNDRKARCSFCRKRRHALSIGAPWGDPLQWANSAESAPQNLLDPRLAESYCPSRS